MGDGGWGMEGQKEDVLGQVGAEGRRLVVVVVVV